MAEIDELLVVAAMVQMQREELEAKRSENFGVDSLDSRVLESP